MKNSDLGAMPATARCQSRVIKKEGLTLRAPEAPLLVTGEDAKELADAAAGDTYKKGRMSLVLRSSLNRKST